MLNTTRSISSQVIAAVLICLFTVPAATMFAAGDMPEPIPIQIELDGSGVEMTRWVDPQGRTPISYAQWRTTRGPERPFEMNLARTATPSKRGVSTTSMCIIVNTELYPSIESALDQYMLDLTGELYVVALYTSSGGTPEEMRSFLQQQYLAGMEGCVLIGDLPVPWYETWCGDPPAHQEFPCDLFYMDLDGVFTDSDVNGMYDTHTGDQSPEIWMGRLTASVINIGGGDELSLLQNYFYKNHLYRCGLMGVTNRALVYIDDDWAGGGEGWDLEVGAAYNTRTTVLDKWTTWADDYESRLPVDYEFIQVCVHSSPHVHGFKNPLDEWSWTYNDEIIAIDPPAVFYNLFACSNARFVENDNMGGCYIFCDGNGLASIGSTKTGSMLDFGSFYTPFGDGVSIGEAFRRWFAAQASGGFADWQVCWYYGMTLQGDPTLTAQKKATGATLSYDLGSASYMSAIYDGSDWDYYNVRFTPTQLCTLAAVTVEGYFPGAPAARVYIYNSDGLHPTTVIDSAEIPSGSFPGGGTKVIDLSEKNLVFGAGQDFHIGFTIVKPTPQDTLWIYMDAGVEPDEHRSSLLDGEVWRTQYDIYGWDYNFMIRAVVNIEPEPEVLIITLTIPDGQAGDSYNAPIDVEGGTLPYNWDLTAGTPPQGLMLDPSSGVIGGTPTESGSFIFTVRATDASDPSLYDVQHLAMSVTWLCADINADGNAGDIADLVHLVDWMFNEGPAPVVMDAANVDGEGEVDIGDLVYLVDYMFNAGPAPGCE